jgi:hypothetical protein
VIDRPTLRSKCVDAARGLKTLLAAALFFGLGLADYFDAVNVRPLMDQALGENKSAKVMLFLPIVFATLRFLTSGKVRWFNRDKEPF